ncbi:MAG: GntR family transcriptional regulator, partial [Acetatifactor sp.]|nr:GntR family transcriptional regulator [Acetatifactor sp.]
MILLDYRDKRPIYEQVVEKLEKLIMGGALETDSKMPSVRAMGMDLAVHPNTIQRAYNQLE